MKKNLPPFLNNRYIEVYGMYNERMQNPPAKKEGLEGLLDELDHEIDAAEYVFLGFVDSYLGNPSEGTIMMMEMGKHELGSFYDHVSQQVNASRNSNLLAQLEEIEKKYNRLTQQRDHFLEHKAVWEEGAM